MKSSATDLVRQLRARTRPVGKDFGGSGRSGDEIIIMIILLMTMYIVLIRGSFSILVTQGMN